MQGNQAVLLDNIGKIIVFLIVFFSIYLVTVKSKKKLSNYIFAAFLLLIGFDLSGLFLGEFYYSKPLLGSIRTPSSLIQMPLWYLYVLSICYADFKLKWKDLLHLIPFLVFVIIIWFQLFPEHSKNLFEVVGEIQYFIYIFLVFRALQRHKKVYLENYANPDYTAYKWLFQATLLFCLAHVLVLSRWILSYSETLASWIPIINILVTVSALFVTCWLVMKSMYKPQLFMGTLLNQKPTKTHSKKAINSDEVRLLKVFMKEQKPYLDYNLSLEKLANLIEKDEKELSIIINQDIGKHFFDFINEYRITDAKSILENPENAKMTVLEILYQVGFNSKSSFYTAFKKETGQTPLNYRKSTF